MKINFLKKLLFSTSIKEMKIDPFENQINLKKLFKHTKIKFFFIKKVIFYPKKSQINTPFDCKLSSPNWQSNQNRVCLPLPTFLLIPLLFT